MSTTAWWRQGLLLAAFMGLAAGCGPRVFIATGTTVGLKATPGDPQAGRSPQVTLGYKRAEVAIVATEGTGARHPAPGPDGTVKDEDAYSTLASFGFTTAWTEDTELSSFIATGFAARGLTAQDGDAPQAAKADVVPPPPPPPAMIRRERGAVRGPAAVAPPAPPTTGNRFLDAAQAN